MPFTIIAVTVLILSMGYGVVTYRISDAEDNVSNVTEELKRLEASVDRTASFVNRGMGELLISVGNGSGTLSSKADDFESSAETWIEKQFPSYDGNVRIVPLNLDVGLHTEALRSSDGGRMPTYLRAEGTFTARFECGAGTTERTLAVRSDGSCALPLVEEMGSLFEAGLRGEGSMLSQMMSYQLTALAQERVIRGYGSLAAQGSMGTNGILTAEDVEKSYRSCVTAMELLYFRDSEEGFFTETGHVDLADLLASEDGFLTLDLGAVYAQALVSVTDELVLQWEDYFCGNVMADFLDNASDKVRNAWDSLVGFFTRKDTMSAAPYIREIMERNGYSESDYRYLLNGKTVSYHVSETSITRMVNGEEHTVTVGGFTNVLEYPNVDILNWNGIRNFKSEYREEHNFIREWTRSILNTAAVKIGSDRSLGQVSVPVVFDDDVPFTENVMDAVRRSLSGLDGGLERSVRSSIDEQTIYDPFYGAICEKLTQGFDSAFGVDALKAMMTEHPELAATQQRLLNSGLRSEDVTYLMDSLRASLYDENVISHYEAEAKKMSGRFSVLLEVPGGQSGLIRDFLTMAGMKILPAMALLYDMPMRMTNLCEEMCDNMNLNPYSGLTELPSERYFVLEDPEDAKKEFISVTDRLSPNIEILGPNNNLGDCIHYVGFNEKKGAAYCTVFRVVLTDGLEYSAEGKSTEAALLGTRDSYISGTVPIHVDLKIPVMSGWQLEGVYGYKASTTFLEDGWKILLDALDPILKPIRELLKIINEVISILGPALMEIMNYATAVIEKLYSAIMGPMLEIKNFAEGELSAMLDRAVGGYADMVEFIFRATLKKQTVGISFLGMALTFSTDIASFVKNVKNVLIVELSGEVSGVAFNCGMTINERDLSKGKERFITSEIKITGEDWNLRMKLDPMMKTGNRLASLNGIVKNTSLDVVFPHTVQYREAGVRLSDLDGIGAMLSNIPLPALGMKGSLDAGLSLKYDIPFKTGVVVNEFESNPPGNDVGNEWVELYNASATSADITGYTLVAGSNTKTKRMTLGEIVLAPRELYVVNLDSHMVLMNDKNNVLDGECIILLDREGKEVDRSIVGKDRENNSYTWQRVADGAVDWVFAEGTPGTGNCGGFVNGELVKGTMLKIFKESAVKTMNDMGGLLDGTEDLSEFLQRAIQDAITTAIEHISGCLIEASVFVSFDVTDLAGTTATGFRIALSINTKTVSETIKYLVGEVEALLFNMENPYGIDGRSLPYDNIHLSMTAHTGMNTPKFLNKTDVIPTVDVGVFVSSNLSGLCGLFGRDVGRWSVTAGIVLEDCPSVLLPSAIKINPEMRTDLWLVKAVIGRA
jgi:hypothetical protein